MTSDDQVFSGPTIRASAKRDGDKIVVEYSIHNSYDLEIYVFDQMIRYEGNKPVVDPTTAYAFFEEPATIRLVRATLRLPLEKEVRVLEIPFARRVPPGADASGKIVLSDPAVEKSPFYAPPKPETSKKVDCSRIHLIVGWSEFKKGMNVLEVDGGLDQKVLRIRGAWDAPYLRFLNQDIVLPVQLIVHTDTFDRQMPLQ